MKNKNKNAKHVQCPYFRWLNDYSVCCEGLYRNSTLKITFNDINRRKAFVRAMCGEQFCDCEIFKMIDQTKYSE